MRVAIPKMPGNIGGITVRAIMDFFSSISEFEPMTEARDYQHKFHYHQEPSATSPPVFDKANTKYLQFAKCTNESIWFVTRETQFSISYKHRISE